MNRNDDLADAMCSGNMMLEPRLQEYLKKKTYYKKNNIKPSLPLEEEFMITPDDLKRLRCFLKGDKGIYKHDRQAEFIDSNECQGYDDSKKFNFFPSREFKNDPHFKLLQKKMQRDKEAEKQRHNYDSYVFMKPKTREQVEEAYNTYENSNLVPDSGDSFDLPTFLDSNNNEFDNKYRANKFKSNDTRTYNVPPKMQYRQRVPTLKNNYIDENKCIPHTTELESIIGSLDSYNDHVNINYQHKNEMDTENKLVLPSMNSKDKKYINTSGYQPIPVMKKDGLKDVNMESIMRGMPSKDTRKKSYGYSNPSEHYFDYITDEMQQPDHIVLPFPRGGSATRPENKANARPYKRDIY